jgi:hypothetical protein
VSFWRIYGRVVIPYQHAHAWHRMAPKHGSQYRLGGFGNLAKLTWYHYDHDP